MFFAFVFGHPFLAAGIVILIWRLLFTKRCNAPGPWGFPLVGYLPFMDKRPWKTGLKLKDAYGDIAAVNVGMRTLVFLNTFDAVHDAFGNHTAFNGRPNVPSLRTIAESGNSRFAFRNGDARWKFLRKCATKAIGMFASSRNSKLQAVVHDGLHRFTAEVDEEAGKAFDPSRRIFELISGIMGAIAFGIDYDPKHPLLQDVLGLQERVGGFVSVSNAMDNLPFGKYIYRRKIDDFLKNISCLMAVSEQQIQQHEYTGADDAVRDLSDALLATAAQTPQHEKDAIGITDPQIIYISQDLFTAGFATTMDSFIWLLNLTAAHPQVQKKVHSEIDNVLGDSSPTLYDRPNLPYTEAVVYEGFRFASLVPLGLPHATMEDVTFRGYFIPKGCTVLANLYAINHDPKVFPEPDSFKPERFIDEGKLDIDLGSKVTPFSTGKRRCVGENLARQELSLIYASVMQRYEISFAPGQEVDLTATAPGFTRSPGKYKLIFKSRF